MYPEDQQPKSYSDEEINSYRKTHDINAEPQHHKHAKLVLIFSFILLASIVGGLSYYLVNDGDEEQQKAAEAVVQQQVQTEKKPAEAVALSSEWLLFESPEYDIRIPDGWNMQHQDNAVLLLSCDSAPKCYDLQTGTTATIEQITGGRDGLQGLSYSLQTLSSTETIDDYTAGYTKSKDLAGGYALYSRIVKTSSSDDMLGNSLPVGTKEYLVIKQIDSKQLSYFYYSVVSGQTDPTKLVEEMTTTLTIK